MTEIPLRLRSWPSWLRHLPGLLRADYRIFRRHFGRGRAAWLAAEWGWHNFRSLWRVKREARK